MGHRDLLVTQIYLRAKSQTPALTHAAASAVPAASFLRANLKLSEGGHWIASLVSANET